MALEPLIEGVQKGNHLSLRSDAHKVKAFQKFRSTCGVSQLRRIDASLGI